MEASFISAKHQADKKKQLKCVMLRRSSVIQCLRLHSQNFVASDIWTCWADNYLQMLHGPSL